MRIRFSPQSVDDLKRLHDFLARYDCETARTTALNLKSAITRFAEQPRMGRPVENLADVREFVFGRYVVRYLVRGEWVFVLRIWHCREERA
ncbi:MAG: type II toxin-antitoxin system RelE/ParE family toxin [Desulfovibrionaceae bacterium]